MPVHANSLANLKSFPPGQSGNPGGRPRGVTYPTEWMRGMAGLTSTEIQRIRDDEDETVSRRIAAGMYLDALRAQSPRARKEAVSEICDRTSGKPRQQLEVATRTRRSAKEIIATIKRKYALYDEQAAKLPGPADGLLPEPPDVAQDGQDGLPGSRYRNPVCPPADCIASRAFRRQSWPVCTSAVACSNANDDRAANHAFGAPPQVRRHIVSITTCGESFWM